MDWAALIEQWIAVTEHHVQLVRFVVIPELHERLFTVLSRARFGNLDSLVITVNGGNRETDSLAGQVAFCKKVGASEKLLEKTLNELKQLKEEKEAIKLHERKTLQELNELDELRERKQKQEQEIKRFTELFQECKSQLQRAMDELESCLSNWSMDTTIQSMIDASKTVVEGLEMQMFDSFMSDYSFRNTKGASNFLNGKLERFSQTARLHVWFGKDVLCSMMKYAQRIRR